MSLLNEEDKIEMFKIRDYYLSNNSEIIKYKCNICKRVFEKFRVLKNHRCFEDEKEKKGYREVQL